MEHRLSEPEEHGGEAERPPLREEHGRASRTGSPLTALTISDELVLRG